MTFRLERADARRSEAEQAVAARCRQQVEDLRCHEAKKAESARV